MSVIGNMDWLARQLASSDPMQVTWIGDSLTGTGANSNYSTYYVGSLNQWRPKYGIFGWMVQGLELGSNMPGVGSFHNTTQTGSTTTVIRPGQSTPDGNDGLHLGNEFWYRSDYATARADNADIHTFRLNPTDWFAADPTWFERQRITGRMFFLPNASGPENYKVRGYRGGATIETKVVNLLGFEEAIAVDVDCGVGPGSAELRFLGGGGADVNKIAVHGHCQFFVPGGRGMAFDSLSKGGWGSAMWASEAGSSLNEGTGYTARVTDAALARILSLNKIAGSGRVFWIMLGQNDSGLSASQHRANIVATINRLSAAEPGASYVIQSPPDPGTTPSSRYLDYDNAAESISRELDSQARRVGWIRGTQLLGAGRTMHGAYGAASMFDAAHPTLLGAQLYMQETWRAISDSAFRIMRRRSAVPIGRISGQSSGNIGS